MFVPGCSLYTWAELYSMGKCGGGVYGEWRPCGVLSIRHGDGHPEFILHFCLQRLHQLDDTRACVDGENALLVLLQTELKLGMFVRVVGLHPSNWLQHWRLPVNRKNCE